MDLPEILSATLFPVLLWVIIMVLDWRLGLSLISLLPVAFLLQMAVKTLWGKSFQHFMESTQKMSEDLLEYVATISVIKVFSNEENRTEQVLGGMRDYIRWVKQSMFSVTVPMTFDNDVLGRWYRGNDSYWTMDDEFGRINC